VVAGVAVLSGEAARSKIASSALTSWASFVQRRDTAQRQELIFSVLQGEGLASGPYWLAACHHLAIKNRDYGHLLVFSDMTCLRHVDLHSGID
jgi:hypothetical protein